MGTEQIRRNVRTKETAMLGAEVLIDASLECAEEDKLQLPRFWKYVWKDLKLHFQAYLPKKETTETAESVISPMTAKEAKTFECTEIPFGVHEGSQIKDTPVYYLLRIDERPDVLFRLNLRRYLLSERGQAIQENE